MNIKNLILERISKDEIDKLNFTCYHLSLPEVSASNAKTVKDNTVSSFYNTKDLSTGGFHKNVSRFISRSAHEKF